MPKKVNAKEMADRNVPWGVPAEAHLGPLELLELVCQQGIPCDPDEDVVWIPAGAPDTAPREIIINDARVNGTNPPKDGDDAAGRLLPDAMTRSAENSDSVPSQSYDRDLDQL